MDLNAQQDNKLLNLKCLEHKKQIQFIYLQDQTKIPLICSTCFVQKTLAPQFIIEIDDLINSNQAENLKVLLPKLNKSCQQYLDSENMNSSNKAKLIEKVQQQFDEFTEVILSNIDKLKKQLINHITSTEDQRLSILKIINQTDLIEDLKVLLTQFSDDPMKLNDQLKELILAKKTCQQDDKKKIEDSLKNHMNLFKQIDLKHIYNIFESILQKFISSNILLQDDDEPDSNSMSIQNPQSFLIEEILQIKSIEQLKSTPNFSLYENIEIKLQQQNIEDYEINEVCNELIQCKNINYIELDLDDGDITDKGIGFLCKLISEMIFLTDFSLSLCNNTKITKKGVSQLAQALSQYSNQITNLDLNLNYNKNISDSVVLTSIIPLFNSCNNLSVLGLKLSNTKIRGNTVIEIADMIKSLPQLKNLYLGLSENNIDKDDSIIYLSNEGIKSLNSQIQILYLWLDSNQLTDQSATSLMNTIQTCQCLRGLTFNLSNNRIGQECLEQLVEFQLTLKENHCKNLMEIEMNYSNQE